MCWSKAHAIALAVDQVVGFYCYCHLRSTTRYSVQDFALACLVLLARDLPGDGGLLI